jgi:uncharacterized protein YbaR (Trm112 family)
MDTRRLVEMACPAPSCAGSLQVDRKAVQPRFAAEPAHELLEGFVRCENCRRDYPVVAGIAILVEDVKTYLSSHYALLLTCAVAEGVLGPDMLGYLRANGYDLIELNQREHSYAHQSLYISSHYDDLGVAISPLASSFADYLRTRYDNFYDLLIQKASENLGRNCVALDVGCSVGGMIYRVAPFCASAFGIDDSFAATLTARTLWNAACL